ncbi:MAG TPA: hypothetical protein DIW81_15880 [Planctomycetaceae bacterium]|nr:hypothetical protein [Rubinisphaera sp.]HCS53047.1 hypothetical protein [Planctomycetaceae bacterium]
MNELTGKKINQCDEEVIRLGFCPTCHCSESTVKRTKKVQCSAVRNVHGQRARVSIMKIIRYRKCENCGNSFRTTEESSSC